MIWRQIFDGYKIKNHTDSSYIAYFVYKNTNYKMFTNNGDVYSIDSTNGVSGNEVTPENITFTKVCEVKDL